MAQAKKARAGKTPAFWREQLETASERLGQLDEEAQQALGELVERGRKSRDEIEQLLKKAGEVDLAARAEEIRSGLEKSGTEVMRGLERLQESALAVLGVAGRAQVKELGAEVQRLARKIEQLARSAPRKATPKAKSHMG